MDVKDHPVISVLGDQRRFVVPIYQRQYSWKEPRLAPFWDDVVAKAEEVLEGRPKFNHFMGALILAPGGDGFTIGSTPKVQVVDGQQRLTTFQLFLAAIREVGNRVAAPDLTAMVQSYLFVPALSGEKDPDARFRLIPTPDDRAIFHLIIEGGLAAAKQKHPDYFYKNGNFSHGPNSLRAFDFFITKIDRYAKTGLIDDEDAQIAVKDEAAAEPARRLQALLAALLNHLKLVVITLSETDDAQVIFETLNSQAEPLLAMDLVRNNIFQRASIQGESAEKLFEEKWRPFDQDGAFWKADSPRAKPKRPRIDHFLSHALTAQTGAETSLRELYAEYRSFTRPKGKVRFATVGEELDALIAFRPIYKSLEVGGGDPSLERLGLKLNLFEVSTVYPFVFRVSVSDIATEEKDRIYNLIYSYLVRRTLCGLTPKNLNKTFARIVSDTIENGVSVSTFLSSFSRQKGDTVRFPDDNEFRAAFLNAPAYQLTKRKERLAEILWDLEIAARNKYSVNTPRPESMSVEHILPQTWTKHWSLPDGRMAPSDKLTGADQSMLNAIRVRDSSLHTMGNLTLITVPANSTASNKAFSEKRAWLKQSLLALNVPLFERDSWHEEAITSRSKMLADTAIEIWPGPDSIQ
ncbi:DUF262 domain-containing protein [Rhodopseudomonas sp. P2A-2r]|uniref:DUF262 domain-containing protein n=1 Tax=Rhodopseudomonas sp. P2A-2r TaxID=2991972 RepID=UPI0022343579|nr:DUF262 domain-containing protein [Rhodopseudomonas sp. P2A-2r]UZE49802.1 DUF262 domain-containing protein [Rhodopseudomonas sp. P2A-2r]